MNTNLKDVENLATKGLKSDKENKSIYEDILQQIALIKRANNKDYIEKRIKLINYYIDLLK